MFRVTTKIIALALGAALSACGSGGSAGPGEPEATPGETTISALTVETLGPDSAVVSFATAPADDAIVRVWLATDAPGTQPVISRTSQTAGNHAVTLDTLWSASPWRAEISAGGDTAVIEFSTAYPQWPADCRAGNLTLPVDGAGSWSIYADGNASIGISPSDGCAGAGARLAFDLGDGEWVVAASNDYFSSPVDLSEYSHLLVPLRGTAGLNTSLEIKLRDSAGALSVARMDGGAGVPVWRSWVVDLREFVPQTGTLDFSDIAALEFALSSPLDATGARSGILEIGSLSAWNSTAERPLVGDFERIARNEPAMAAIANDLLARQRSHGFLPAWFDLAPDWNLYANAMALIVFALEYERLDHSGAPAAGAFLDAAYLLADRLVELQELSARGGGWDDSYREVDGNMVLKPTESRIVWVGSTAWAGIALLLARDLLPDSDRYTDAVIAATQFYDNEQSCRTTAGLPAGSVTEGTEGNISSHLFLAAAAARGLSDGATADELADFIAGTLFDPQQQRFFCGVQVDFGSGFDRASCSLGGSGAVIGADARSCLDVIANWGAEWLQRQGRPADALLGLAYSRLTFATRAFDDATLHGLGDIAGPWTPTVEHGAGQWAASGGPDANYVITQAYAGLCNQGACRGAADDFSAGIGWNTVSTGIAPGAWMYLAWHGGFWSRL